MISLTVFYFLQLNQNKFELSYSIIPIKYHLFLNRYNPNRMPQNPTDVLPIPACPLHTVNFRVLCPIPERLSKIPENDSSKTPQERQAHVRYDGWDIATLDNPRCNELRKAVSPDILVDSDSDKDRSCDRFVGIDRICGGDRW